MGPPNFNGIVAQLLAWNVTEDNDFTDSSQAFALPTDTDGNAARAVRFQADQDCYVRFGDSTVTVSSSNGAPLTADIADLAAVSPGVTHMAVIQKTTNGTISITVLR